MLGLFLLLGLLNVFGQQPHTDTASAEPASSSRSTRPQHLRSGLFFMSRFTIRARRGDRGSDARARSGLARRDHAQHARALTRGEANRDGKIALDLGHGPAGAEHVFFLHFQVNPTEFGRRAQDVALSDGETPLLQIDRTVTIFP